ncbi:MAG: hypothetical protein ACR2QT_11000 [Woeseiaceae bacterium]
MSLLFACLAGTVASGPSIAGEPATANVNEARQLLQAGRKEIVRDELRLSEEEADAFWPVYQRYQDDLTPVRDRYAELLADYMEAYRAGTVTEDFAIRLVDDYLEIQTDLLDIKKKHLSDFRAALPVRKAARFYQLENKMEGEMAGQLALIVPLIDPV